MVYRLEYVQASQRRSTWHVIQLVILPPRPQPQLDPCSGRWVSAIAIIARSHVHEPSHRQRPTPSTSGAEHNNHRASCHPYQA